MVRGPAALLGLLAAALGYFLAAPALPALRPFDVAVGVAAAVGLTFVATLAAAPAPAIDAPLNVVPALLGAGLLVAALNAGDAGAAATPFEAILFGCLGVIFAAVLDVPPLAVALPLFVAAIDLSGALGAPGTLLAEDAAARGDPLTLELPMWGGGAPAARTSIAEVAFLAAYTAYARRFELRPAASVLAMFGALVAAVILGLVLDRGVPALALMSTAFLAVNADRLTGLFARAHEG